MVRVLPPSCLVVSLEQCGKAKRKGREVEEEELETQSFQKLRKFRTLLPLQPFMLWQCSKLNMQKGGCQLPVSWRGWHRGSTTSSGASAGASLYTYNDRGKRRANCFIQFILCYCTVYRVTTVGAGKEEAATSPSSSRIMLPATPSDY